MCEFSEIHIDAEIERDIAERAESEAELRELRADRERWRMLCEELMECLATDPYPDARMDDDGAWIDCLSCPGCGNKVHGTDCINPDCPIARARQALKTTGDAPVKDTSDV